MRLNSNIYRYITTVCVALLFCLSISLPSQADDVEDAEDAQIFINQLADQAFVALGKKDLSYQERQAEFRIILSASIDVEYVARFVLGPYSRKATDDQIVSFTNALEDYIILTYAYRFREFHVEDIIITGVKPGKRDTMLVSSDVDLPGDAPNIRVDWRTHKVGEDWKVIDISIEGLSMMTVQREEYVAVIRQGGGKVDYLIQALEKKNVKLAKRTED